MGKKKISFSNFYNDNNNWLVYDVDVLGVSIVQTYRSQFGDILANQGFDALLQKLESIVIE